VLTLRPVEHSHAGRPRPVQRALGCYSSHLFSASQHLRGRSALRGYGFRTVYCNLSHWFVCQETDRKKNQGCQRTGCSGPRRYLPTSSERCASWVQFLKFILQKGPSNLTLCLQLRLRLCVLDLESWACDSRDNITTAVGWRVRGPCASSLPCILCRGHALSHDKLRDITTQTHRRGAMWSYAFLRLSLRVCYRMPGIRSDPTHPPTTFFSSISR
jgi:hypothetical protein